MLVKQQVKDQCTICSHDKGLLILHSYHFPLSRVTYHFFWSSLSRNYIGKDFQRFPMFPKGLPVVSNVLSLGSLGYRDGEIK